MTLKTKHDIIKFYFKDLMKLKEIHGKSRKRTVFEYTYQNGDIVYYYIGKNGSILKGKNLKDAISLTKRLYPFIESKVEQYYERNDHNPD